MSKKSSRSFTAIIVILVILALANLGYDVWQVASGHADLNRHIPFLMPAVFVAFAAMARKIDQLS